MDEKLYCILLRGKPAAGKTTLNKSLNLQNFELLDPDAIVLDSEEFREFKPRKYKNPSINIKKYCYLFAKAEINLKNGRNILWTQPWSRLAEIELTIRNLGYYFTDLGNSIWTSNLKDIVSQLPFRFIVIEIDVNDELAFSRYMSRKQNIANKEELDRLKKTLNMYQKYLLPTDYFVINGMTNIQTVKDKFSEILSNI